MRFKYEYEVYEDYYAATEISKSREKGKMLHAIAWGWIALFSIVAFFALLFGKSDISLRSAGIIIAAIAMAISAFHWWYLMIRYDKTTGKKINDAITKYISGNKKFIESDKKIDSLGISDEVITKLCMGCGVISRTQRCTVRKNGHKIILPLCECCVAKLNGRCKRESNELS